MILELFPRDAQNKIEAIAELNKKIRCCEKDVKKIIKELKKMKVEKVGPSHCTGGRPIELFKDAWDEDPNLQ